MIISNGGTIETGVVKRALDTHSTCQFTIVERTEVVSTTSQLLTGDITVKALVGRVGHVGYVLLGVKVNNKKTIQFL